MAVPYTFAGATSSIPLSQLDTNFASTITLGNTAIQLGNTVTTLNNMTLANVTISSGNVTITNVTVTTANVTVGNITTLTGTSATYTNIASGNVTITGGTLNNVAIGGTTAASGAFTTLSASGAFSLTGDQVQISEGGTGQTTANAAFNALAPSQTGNSGKYLKTDGTDTSWDAIDINTADITGTLPILNGGTGQTTANAAFNALAPSQTSQSGKYLKTDGTNASWDALDISTADITGTLPIANGGTGLTALGTGVQTALGQNVTGSGGIVLATSPVLTTPNLGTPSAATLTNATGLPISTGVSGLGTNVATALAVNVGTAGAFVVNGGALGTPSGGTLTNCTGYPTSALSGSINLATQVTGTLATTNGGTGLTSFTANGVVYASSTSALTTGSALTFDGTNFGLGGSADAWSGTYRALQVNGTVPVFGSQTQYMHVLSNAYNDGSWKYKVSSAAARYTQDIGVHYWDTAVVGTAGAALTWNEQMRLTSTGLGIGTSSPGARLDVQAATGTFKLTSTTGTNIVYSQISNTGGDLYIGRDSSAGSAFYSGSPAYGSVFMSTGAYAMAFATNSLERIRITSAGDVGIGTSSPSRRLDVRETENTAASSTSFWNIAYGGVVVNNLSNTANTVSGIGFYGGSAATSISGVGNILESTSLGALGFFTGGSGRSNTVPERMRLDSSGNLGLGVTPSAWQSATIRPIEINRIGNFVGGNGSAAAVYLGANTRFESASWRYANNGAAGLYTVEDNTHFWRIAASGTAGNAISFTTAMTLDASGQLSIGATSANSTLTVGNTDATATITSGGTNTHLNLRAMGSGGVLIFGAGGVSNGTPGTERARITSGGDLLVGTTSAGAGIGFTTKVAIDASGDFGMVVKTSNAAYECINTWNSATSGTRYHMYFRDGASASARGSITTDGANTAYNTSSDYRLKDNPQPLTGSGAFIDALKPKTWIWKETGATGVGFIAHEVQEISPGSVTGTKDAVDEKGKPIMQAMEYGSAEFIANIIAELQSLRARVAQLEGASV